MNLKDAAREPALVDVQLAYEQWRSTRTVRGVTPERLRAMAVRLLSSHSSTVVCDALGVNATALKQWAKQTVPEPEHPHTPRTDFVSVSLLDEPEPPAIISGDSSPFIIQFPNGVQVSVAGSCNLTRVLAAAHALGASA